jgi:hypothetical protein
MIDLNTHNDSVKLLWTGGWDFTFRLCELILLKKVKVQPIYLIDSDRLSFPIEIRTMYKIKSLLVQKSKSVENMILPIFFLSINDIKKNYLTSKRYMRLNRTFNIGGQYDWIARFAEQFNMSDLEVCWVHGTVHANTGLHYLLQKTKCIVEDEDRVGKYFKVVEYPADSDLHLFDGLKFPILSLSKINMQEIAQKEGFLDILNETWFCHKPTKNLKPCGTCNPCLQSIEKGMGHRFPKIALLKASMKRLEKNILSSQNKAVLWLVNLLRAGRNYLRSCTRFVRGKVKK